MTASFDMLLIPMRIIVWSPCLNSYLTQGCVDRMVMYFWHSQYGEPGMTGYL